MTEREIFFEALEMDTPEARAAFLQGACGRDVTLRRKVDELLKEHFSNDSLLAGSALEGERTAAVESSVPEVPAQMLGRYKLLEKIGEGGFGEVWMAEQREPVKRRVALKIIKLGMDSRQIVARFEAERQALAMMDHPNIAKIFDAGTTENPHSASGHPLPSDGRGAGGEGSPYVSAGRPYFVMELVRGIKITEYCDQNQLPTQERLRLFILVCQAIQHAHQKGIIHRDIKPSNILVTLHDGTPVPKVIDFGIAKATQQELTDKTVFTQFQQFIGTPAYISPEQAEMSGLDIDTRADIYSLGVLLYELLVGQTPFDAKEMMQGGLDALRQIIREKEPLRPSTKLSQTLVAAGMVGRVPPRALSSGERISTGGAHGVTRPTMQSEEEVRADSRRLLRIKETITLLRGDLDWIVMKCLEKDRARRYETANGLVSDIQRHLNNEAVLARPASAAYRFQKFLRRNKIMAGATVLVLIAVLVGTVVSIGQALRARRELRRALAAEARALTEKTNAVAALRFIQGDVLSQAAPVYQPDRDLSVRALLDRVAERLDRGGHPPLVEASIRQTIGSVYTELGDYAKAVRHYEAALQLQRRHLGESDPDTLRTLYGLAMSRWWGGAMVESEALTRQGLEQSRRALGEKNPLTLQFMQARAYALLFLGEMPWTELEPLFLQALALHREVLGPDHIETFKVIHGLIFGYDFHWQAGKAVPLLVDTFERSRRVLGEEHPQTASFISMLAIIFSQLNRLEEAEVHALRVLEVRRSILGEEHPLTINSLGVLARIYVQQQRLDKADPLTDRTLDLARRLPVENSPFLIHQLSNLGWNYLELGQVARADTLCEVALQAMRRKPDANPLTNPRILTHLGALRLVQERYTEAETLLRESSRLGEKYLPDAAYRFYTMSLLGASLAGQKKYADAEPFLLQGCQGLQQRQAMILPYLKPTRRNTESLERLVQLYDAWGKPVRAAEWRQKLAEFEQSAKAKKENQ